ncbi:MAG: hypothetical protein JWM76_1736 [Pseudonocardiales bacterium]|nr:hypothetical protein [Pseudonocardiales bacterium]
MELILVRHGLPVRTHPDDAPPDPQLSTTGLAQAEALGEWLADERIDAIYSSPLRRAVQTSQPLLAGRSIEVKIEPDLAELSLGEAVYVPFEDLSHDDPLAQMWRDQFADQQSPNLLDFRARVAAAVGRIASRHPSQVVAIVCHAAVINAVLADALGVKDTLVFEIGYSSTSRLRVSKTGRRGIITVNDSGHLRGFGQRP